MIVTPEFAINPKGFKKAEAFSLSDAIPVEKGSGFGGYLDKLTLIRDTVTDYVEVSSTMTINVAGRDADLFIRLSGAAAPWLTIEGNLRNGRKIVIDASGLTSAGKVTIGGVTHDISSSWGIGTFYWTSSGVSSHSAFFGNVQAEGNLVINGRITPGVTPWTGYNVKLDPGETYLLPRGILFVEQEALNFPFIESNSMAKRYEIMVEFNSVGGAIGGWHPVDSRLGAYNWRVTPDDYYIGYKDYLTLISDGAHFRIRNVDPTFPRYCPFWVI